MVRESVLFERKRILPEKKCKYKMTYLSACKNDYHIVKIGKIMVTGDFI